MDWYCLEPQVRSIIMEMNSGAYETTQREKNVRKKQNVIVKLQLQVGFEGSTSGMTSSGLSHNSGLVHRPLFLLLLPSMHILLLFLSD